MRRKAPDSGKCANGVQTVSYTHLFLMIFYTDVCGISMAAVSLLMLVSRFWDAINDPVIGSLSDRKMCIRDRHPTYRT